MSTASAPLLYRIDDIEIDLARGVLRRGGEELHLKPKAFAILLHLIASRDRLVTREELLELFWKDAAVTDDALTQCIAELRRAFQDDARNPRYLKTVPRRGFRFVAEVEEVRPAIAVVAREEVTTVEIEETYSDEPRSLRAGPRNKRYLVWTAAAALVLGSAGLYLAARGGVPAEPRPAAGKRQVVVLPFENQSGQSDVDWLRDGLPDMLTATLTRTPSVDVLSREQAALWIGRIGKTGLPAAIEVARRGHAQIAVTGSFARLGSAIRVDARIYDGGTGALVAADSLTAEPDQVLRQVDYLGGRLAARLRAKSGGDDRRDLASLMTNNLEAYRDYELGMRLVDSMQVREGIQLLEKAIALDPKFVMAYARVGYAYAVGGYELEKGRPYLEKAFQMGERLTAKDRERLLAWYALAHRDYQDAIRRYAALIAAYPNETEAYRRLGSLLRGESRDEEAIAVERQALAIDPEDPRIYNALAAVSSETGRHEQAIEAARQFTVLSPGDANALDTLGLAYDFAGRYVEAEAAFRQAIALNPAFEVPRIHLVQLHGRMGREREARQESLERAAATRSLVDCSRYWGEIAWAAWRGRKSTASCHSRGPRMSPDYWSCPSLNRRGCSRDGARATAYAGSISSRRNWRGCNNARRKCWRICGWHSNRDPSGDRGRYWKTRWRTVTWKWAGWTTRLRNTGVRWRCFREWEGRDSIWRRRWKKEGGSTKRKRNTGGFWKSGRTLMRTCRRSGKGGGKRSNHRRQSPKNTSGRPSLGGP